jgi:hypothetical protein
MQRKDWREKSIGSREGREGKGKERNKGRKVKEGKEEKGKGKKREGM